MAEYPFQDEVRQRFTYDQETGHLRWRPRENDKRWTAVHAGKIAGSRDKDGYLRVGVAQLYAHRLIWIYMLGAFPPETDHANGIRSDNRWQNLRVATRSQNNANAIKRKGDLTLPKGVHRWAGRFRAQIKVYGHSLHLGMFDTPEEAHLAYLFMARRLYGEFARSA